MAGWATLKYFGYEGFQTILGGILEMQHYLREKFTEYDDIICVNPDDYGLVTLFRVYPKETKAREQYQKELSDPLAKDELNKTMNCNKKWPISYGIGSGPATSTRGLVTRSISAIPAAFALRSITGRKRILMR